jgi:outer membrane lipoprotein-sorting protein
MLKFILVLGLIFSQISFAKENTLQKALDRYAKASSIQTEIKKTDEKVILGTKSQAVGVLKFQKNKIFLSQEGEKKVEFYYANKILTLVEYPDADFDPKGPRKVTTIKKAIPPMVTSLLNLFSNPKAFTKDFAVLSEKIENDTYTAELKPNLRNLKNLKLKINTKKNEISELEFIDDVDTKTTISFSNVKLNSKLAKKDFQFTKLQTDEEMVE